jgi:pimeloyl-ACP methyl ester carboxylesterase
MSGRPTAPALRAASLALLAWAACSGAAADPGDHYVTIPSRPGVRVGYWLMERPNATATVVLLPGGKGGIGLKHGVPTSENFLVRTRERFAAAGLDVAIVGRPSDRAQLDILFRKSPEHVEDLRHVVERLRADLGKPVWLVGTSLGTISAAAAAIALGDAIDGVVLTSSVTAPRSPGAVENLDLDRIRVPVLVVHHRRDACRLTPPEQAQSIIDGLAHAPQKKLVLLDGGADARGDPCEALHWHGFIGMEREAVDAIVDFIRNGRPEPAARAPSRGS